MTRTHRVHALLATLLCMGLSACGGSPGRSVPPKADEDMPQLLAGDEVLAIMQEAARAVDRNMAVAVTDRRGVVLGVGTKGQRGDLFHITSADYQINCIACPSTDIAPDILPCTDCAVVDLAVQLARTAAFFSADQTPLTSRSVRFLSGEHFPPGIMNTAAAALFGIENTNRGCSFDARNPLGADFLPGKFVPRARNLMAALGADATLCQNGIEGGGPGLFQDSPTATAGCTTGIATLPGGVPIYKNGRMAGGIGVVLRDLPPPADPVAAFDSAGILRRTDAGSDFAVAEFAARAFAGDAAGFPTLVSKGLPGVCHGSDAPACCASGCVLGILPGPPPVSFDPVIFVDGIEIPEVDNDPPVSAVGSGLPIGSFVIDPSNLRPPDVSNCPLATDQACPVSSEWLVGPNASTDAKLSQDDVRAIIEAGLRSAQVTRAAIRLPLEARTAMVLAISDTRGALIGLYRMRDATVFSIDVAVAKSRNVIYFSSPGIDPEDTLDCPGLNDCREQAFPPGTAITNRTLSFGAQPFFPSGIEATGDARLTGFPPPFAPGPFRRMFIEDALTPCGNGGQPANGRQNGIVFFPGSAPLYRNGVLVGGLGVSGDGVEQDDIVTIAGTIAAPGFEPPAAIRADQIVVRGVRLPYVKFNRQPEQ